MTLIDLIEYLLKFNKENLENLTGKDFITSIQVRENGVIEVNTGSQYIIQTKL